ncbi:hypothetical protein CPB84DRAFT_256198 [Gymnopilus junonius]|uniref:Secreted protein n=1 Tax=Gymnopilus junonius TaxID=109634 RepID=A0A9P5NDZ8_GYMJU|nr:hypothetical protein CPB84DRAFT_256198 [Gymnopilus junonius]
MAKRSSTYTPIGEFLSFLCAVSLLLSPAIVSSDGHDVFDCYPSSYFSFCFLRKISLFLSTCQRMSARRSCTCICPAFYRFFFALVSSTPTNVVFSAGRAQGYSSQHPLCHYPGELRNIGTFASEIFFFHLEAAPEVRDILLPLESPPKRD